MILEKATFQDLPARGVIAVAGAGGKTTLLHCLAEHYRKSGSRVLLTTTTHMLREKDTVTDPGEAIRKLQREGYAFAGAVDPKNLRKITAFPDKVLRTLILAADVVLVEADGARGLPFKAPKPWEPVVPAAAAALIFVMGMDACGKNVQDVCYNPEGVLAALRETCPGEEKLGEESMRRVYEHTFLRPYLAGSEGSLRTGMHPRLFILENYKKGPDHMEDSFWQVFPDGNVLP